MDISTKKKLILLVQPPYVNQEFVYLLKFLLRELL